MSQASDCIDDLLTVGQAAELLGVTEETVRRYIREQKLRGEKRRSVGIKKVWMVNRNDIARFLED